jgi:quercetin dioxygenase-like cupin family protein
LRYTRVFSDADGESHFEDVEPELVRTHVTDNFPPLLVSESIPAASAAFVSAPRGDDEPEWHNAPNRQFVVWLDGESEVQTSDGEVRRFRTGDVLLVEDTTGKGHLSRGVGESGSRVLFVRLP